MARFRLTTRERRTLAAVAPLILPPTGSRAAMPADAGPPQAAPYVAELISGYELFREGDDPRKLDHRMTEFVGADVAREYEESRLDSVLLLADRSDSITSLPDVERAGSLVVAALGLALARGGHPVEVAHTAGAAPRGVRADLPDQFTELLAPVPRGGHGKAGVVAWTRRRSLARQTCGRLVLVTDAAWPRGVYARALRHLAALAAAVEVVALTREEENRDTTSLDVQAPGSTAAVPAPERAARCLRRLLGRMGRAAERTGRASLTVVRWEEGPRFARSLTAILPELLA